MVEDREAMIRANKLIDIDRRDHLFERGQTVVDLGAAPGGWSQVAAERVGADGVVVALDILPMAPIPGVTCLQADFSDDQGLARLGEALGERRVSVVLSDMAPNLSGVRVADQARSLHLAELALAFALEWSGPDARFLVKVFQGEGFDAYLAEVRRHWRRVVIRKPEASRSRSRETYLMASGFGVV